MSVLEFRDFDPIYGVIEVPAHIYLYRGYNAKYPSVSERPAYFTSDPRLASTYAKMYSNGIAGVFKTTKVMRLLDLRYIKSLLKTMVENSSLTFDNDTKYSYMTLALAYGLCSLQKQLDLYTIRYRDVTHKHVQERWKSMKKHYVELIGGNSIESIEPHGVRIGETSNDAEAVTILKHVFGDIADGYISPNTVSPYNVDKDYNVMSAEIVLFTPQNVIQQVLVHDEPQTKTQIFINELMSSKKLPATFQLGKAMATIYLGGRLHDPMPYRAHRHYHPNAFFDSPRNTSKYKDICARADKFATALCRTKIIDTLDSTYSVAKPLPISPWV